MLIRKELCNRCGKCVAECPKAAINKNGSDSYLIDAGLCNDCKDIFDIECIRVCEPKAITRADGTVPAFDTTWRLRPEHIAWAMAIMGERGKSERFRVGIKEFDEFRKLIAAAFIDPDFKVRLTKNFDDNCIGCPRKQEIGHPEKCGRDDDVCFQRLGLEPGIIIRFWDVIQLVEDKYSIQFMKQWKLYDDAFFGWFRTFVSPDAKVLTNTDP
jgi:Pyruvate/2-oxoacid:ferredoxin oxidoreductase delta subunit